jgi:hypothetical protein
MSAVLKSNIGVSIAESVLNDIISRNSRYYYYLGKILTWNPLGLDDPELPKENYKYELKTRSEIISTKRIRESDVSFVIERINWISGEIYDMYDDTYSPSNLSYSGKSSLEDSKFYVVTDEFNVYKCISNNYNSPSIEKPSGYDTDIFTTSDGYQWKFIYNIPIGFRNKFFESEFMPISTSIRNQFYSRGQLSNVVIENSGQNYIQASTFINVTGDGYLEENPYILNGITITDAGFGYTTTPIATISTPLITLGSEIQATATVSMSGSAISSGTLTNSGYGYDLSASISIAEPISTYIIWQAGISVNLNDKIKYQESYYNVTSSGTLNSTPPTHSSGSSTHGSVILEFVAKRANAIINSNKTEAVISPIVNGNGELIGATIIDGGVGYTYANLEVIGVGQNAQLSVDLSVGDLNTLQANVELLAVDGALSYIKIENNGSNYTSASIIIEGDGTGASATAILSSGVISNIIITNYGSGYTYANVYVVGNGINANLRAIISPKGGHGKNSLLELNARTLMFFTTISNEKNQGIFVNNDSRQLGIIKSLSRFDSDLSFRGDIGSACYLLNCGSIVDQSKFTPDSKLNTGQKEYYIVSVQDNKILITSQLNHIPLFGDVFTSTNGDTITPIEIIEPTIDKYSGNMLFIDNRNAFTTTSDQSLSLRTTIKF